MRKYVLMIVLFLIASIGHEAYSQMNRRAIKRNNRKIFYRGKKHGFGPEKRYNAIGLSINALNYYGDLSPSTSAFSTDIAYTKPGFGLSFTHRFGPRYQLTAAFMYGTLKGSDNKSADPSDASNGAYRYVRNLSFRNRIKELSVVASFDLFENQATYISRVKWTPYIYGGAAVFVHNPQAQVPATDLTGNPLPNAGEWVDLQPLGTEGQQSDQQEGDANYGTKPYPRVQIALPGGIGARFRLNEVLDIAVEFGFRYLFTDYIDDVSKDYVDLNKLDGELARSMSYRSNELKDDQNTAAVQSILDRQPAYDYGTYEVVPGYGHVNSTDSPQRYNKRGESKDNDIFMVTTIRVTYILGKSFHRAKFR